LRISHPCVALRCSRGILARAAALAADDDRPALRALLGALAAVGGGGSRRRRGSAAAAAAVAAPSFVGDLLRRRPSGVSRAFADAVAARLEGTTVAALGADLAAAGASGDDALGRGLEACLWWLVALIAYARCSADSSASAAAPPPGAPPPGAPPPFARADASAPTRGVVRAASRFVDASRGRRSGAAAGVPGPLDRRRLTRRPTHPRGAS